MGTCTDLRTASHLLGELDRNIAALLAARAFTEIRHLAGSAQHVAQDNSPDEALGRIGFLANLSHDLPGVARSRPRKQGDVVQWIRPD
ncbi:hypothetical protein [Streptomyces sp. NPDC059175]|uniref:hypothetical protein n=1 Tax=unclassified Streptomyces TaxID=2593676 RepID=UPI0036CF7296